jgi:hypothetical protein
MSTWSIFIKLLSNIFHKVLVKHTSEQIILIEVLKHSTSEQKALAQPLVMQSRSGAQTKNFTSHPKEKAQWRANGSLPCRWGHYIILLGFVILV